MAFTMIHDEVAEALMGRPHLLEHYRELARHCINKDRCWPGQERLARREGVTPRAIRERTRGLVEAGVIEARKMGRRILYVLPFLTQHRKSTVAREPNTGSPPAPEVEEGWMKDRKMTAPLPYTNRAGRRRAARAARKPTREVTRPSPPSAYGPTPDELHDTSDWLAS